MAGDGTGSSLGGRWYLPADLRVGRFRVHKARGVGWSWVALQRHWESATGTLSGEDPWGLPAPAWGGKTHRQLPFCRCSHPQGQAPARDGHTHADAACPDPPLQFRTAAQACKAGVTLAAQSEKALLRHLSLFPSDTVMQLQQCRARK